MDPQQQAIAEEFDGYRETYDQAVNRAIAFSGQKVESFTRAKANDLLRTVSSRFASPSQLNLLDVGCGIGNYHPFLTPVVGAVSGVDVSRACIEKAQQRNPEVSYSVYDGDRLPYPDGQFDVTFCVCVLHHVPPDRWAQFVSEMRRVTRAGGLIIVYEHNPRHPLTRKVVRDCDFDRDAVLLTKTQTRELLTTAGCTDVATNSILTVPPMGAFVEKLDGLFAKLPFGSQYRAIGRVMD
ncbi:class I SAM-dependent methyltransferase [Bradyrhizobium sp. Tv2a-2]|uniref:class I SAM-dependent methyltransferase n=1 Tax=Bradyrhizobium sp. Tv2a-2 TaxID=113395 RepID=UPI0004209704|nr:class I SAM-dependent methyltransferase [Bradyrhizobium sp. Tv2a-2]